MKMTERLIPWFVAIALIMVMLLLGLLSPHSAQAGPPAQDTRPPGESGNGGNGSGGDGGDRGDSGDSGSAENRCAGLYGQVLNWGVGPAEGATVSLESSSWQLNATSSSDGSYNFGALGVGVATLHVPVAPGQATRPLIQDAGVYLNCDFPIVANVAFVSDEAVEPPAIIQMSADETALAPGNEMELVLTVKNGLPNDITNVVVTDLMPPGLTALAVASSTGEGAGQIIDGGAEGQLVVVNLNRLAAEEEATVRIQVAAAPGLTSGANIRNTATLFYRESAAHQASLNFTVGQGGLPAPVAAAPTATPQAADAFAPPAATPETAPTVTPVVSPEAAESSGEEEIAPAQMPTTGDEAVPPGMLPVTGVEAGTQQPAAPTARNSDLPLFSLVGLVLAILALGSHQLYAWYRTRN